MPSPTLLLRLLGVAAFGAAPLAAVDSSSPNITTGNAIAVPAGGGGVQNTGGNVEVGKGERSSLVKIGGPVAAPALPNALSVPGPAAIAPRNPAADAVARARVLVDAAKARAQAQIDAALAAADRAVAAAQQAAAAAQAHAQQQSDAARANAHAASASSNPDQ